jgi:hypothetical protein
MLVYGSTWGRRRSSDFSVDDRRSLVQYPATSVGIDEAKWDEGPSKPFEERREGDPAYRDIRVRVLYVRVSFV